MTLNIDPGDIINFRYRGKIYRRKVHEIVGGKPLVWMSDKDLVVYLENITSVIKRG